MQKFVIGMMLACIAVYAIPANAGVLDCVSIVPVRPWWDIVGLILLILTMFL